MSGMTTSTMESVTDDWAEKYDYPMVFPMGLVATGRSSADVGVVVVDEDAWWMRLPGADWEDPMAFGTHLDEMEYPKTARVELVGEFLFDTSKRMLAIADRPMRHGNAEDRPSPEPVFRPVDETVGYVTYRFPVNRTTFGDGSAEWSVDDATPVSYEFENPEDQDAFVAASKDDVGLFEGSMVDPGEVPE